MDSIQAIENEKALVRARLEKKLTTPNPNSPEESPLSVGLYEYLGSAINGMGVECPDITKPSDVRTAVRSLNGKQRKELRGKFKEYQEEYFEAVKQFQKGNMDGIKKLPGRAVATLAKGASLGAGAAGIVNTVAPGLFSFLGGILYTKCPDIAAKLGIAAASLMTPQAISAKVILGAGAIAGAAIYGVVKGTGAIAKAAMDHHKEKKDNEAER